jgi:hypothetical protein
MRQQGSCLLPVASSVRGWQQQISFASLSQQRTVSGWSDSSVTRRAATYLVPSA